MQSKGTQIRRIEEFLPLKPTMALGRPPKRKFVFSSSNRGKSVSPVSKRGKFATPEAKKGKPLSLQLKKKKQKGETPSASSRKKAARFQESRAISMFAKLIDTGTVSDHEPVFYLRKKDNSVMKEGRITREGVLCCCCNESFLLSNFEVHAGSTLHRPSANMFVKDGRSLMECLHAGNGMQGCVNVARRRQSSSPDVSEDSNDNTCQICGDGGELMLCDSCPSAFHYNCLHLDAVPEGENWHCSRCRCGSCGLGKGIKDVQDGESMVSCAQCQVPYHQSCASMLQSTGEGYWFCTKICQDIFEKLERLVGCSFPLGGGLSWMLLRAAEEESGAVKGTCYKEKLSEALIVLQQCFDPIVDHETRVNVLSQVVFSQHSNVKRLDCSRFYTMVLMKEECVVCVATVRIHGKGLAEASFIGTGNEFRQQGMCKALMQVLVLMLQGAGVYNLILPSINEVVETWTGSFGFRSMTTQDRKQFAGTNILSFPGCTLLLKCLHDPGSGKCTELVLDGRAGVCQGRSAMVRSKEKVVLESKDLTKLLPISCH